MSKKINPAIAAAAETIAPEVALVATTAIAPFQAISMNLDISLIDPSPLNPRTIFSDEGIQELSDSIQKYGLQSEILVRPKNGRYELIFGERRLRASKKAGLTTIRAKCEDLSDSEAKIRAFIENLQRENLTPIEEGDAFTYPCIRIFRIKFQRFVVVGDGGTRVMGKSNGLIAHQIILTCVGLQPFLLLCHLGF